MESLINSKKTLVISSIDNKGEAAISYSTYIMKDTDLYIYISKTAAHYDYIFNNNKINVMIIEDEAEASSLFARSRVSFKCEAEILLESEEEILNQFSEIHGSNIINTLKKLDFNIFKLKVERGRLVKGFGKAYDVEVSDGKFIINQLTKEDLKGHKNSK